MKKILASGIASILLFSAAPALAKSSCATSEEVTAMNARVLQSDLMVAALSCKQQPAYNAFVKKYNSDLVRRSGSVKGYFQRVYGKGGEHQMNKFITGLANDSSTASLSMSQSVYCAAAQQIFNEALAAEKRDLGALLQTAKFSHKHSVPSCSSVAAAD